MSDFFSFEYFDELPDSGETIPNEGALTRKNQSLSAVSAEVLREAMFRLVPSCYVYGDAGVGERAYELFGICISLNFAPNRSSNLIAASCVMHSCFERRSDLVILPSDIEAKYADLNIRVLRASQIQKFYESMCAFVGLPVLDASIERILGRIFRDGCRIRDESEVTKLIDVGLRFAGELRKVTDSDGTKDGRKRTVRQKYRIETVAAVSAVLACRLCNHTNATQKMIAGEVNLSIGSLYHLIGMYKKTKPQPRDPPVAKFRPKGTAKRLVPLAIGDVLVPSGLSLWNREPEDARRDGLEIVAVAGKPEQIFHDPSDPLTFIFSEPYFNALPPIPTESQSFVEDLVADYADLFDDGVGT